MTESGGKRGASPQSQRDLGNGDVGHGGEVALELWWFDAEGSGSKTDVLGYGQVVVEAEPLGHVPDTTPSRPRRRATHESYHPSGRGQEAEEHLDQGRLARSVGADKTDD